MKKLQSQHYDFLGSLGAVVLTLSSIFMVGDSIGFSVRISLYVLAVLIFIFAMPGIATFINSLRAANASLVEPVREASKTSNEFKTAEAQVIVLENEQYAVFPLKSAPKELEVSANKVWEWRKVQGQSMNKIRGVTNKTSIKDGDFVLVQITSDVDDRAIVLVSIEDKKTMQTFLAVKRYRKDKHILRSETTESGPDYEDLALNTTNAKILGAVYAVAKPLAESAKKLSGEISVVEEKPEGEYISVQPGELFSNPKNASSSMSWEEKNSSFKETRTDDGYMSFPLSILSMPILNQEFAANNIGKSDNEGDSTNGYAEIKTIILDEKEYTVHSLRGSKEVKVTSNRRWEWAKISGNSLNNIRNKPPIMDDDYVLVALQDDANENDIVLVKIQEFASTQYRWIVKRFIKSKGILKSETTESGKEYENIDISKDNATIVGVVYAVAKRI